MRQLATLSTWRGHPQWKCALCAFATTSRARMLDHLNGAHRIRTAYGIPNDPSVEAESTDEPETPAETETGNGTDSTDAG